MKKLVCLMMTLVMICISCGALALNYNAHFENEATFETMEEARENGPKWLAEYTGRDYKGDYCMDDYPAGTTFVYRSPRMYSAVSAAVRMNTTIFVYTDKSFESKDAAKAYLEELGLIDIVNECYGSILLVTPITPVTVNENGATVGGFDAADQLAYYKLQTATCNTSAAEGARGGPRVYIADSAYYGGLTNHYVIGIDGGATFLNNYVVGVMDYVSRIAGLLLIGGSMDWLYDVASPVPAYLVNPCDKAIEKFKAGNNVDAYGVEDGVRHYYNQQLPLQGVYVEKTDEIDLKAIVSKVYNNMFIKAQRIPVIKAGIYNPGTLYTDHSFNQAPYSLGNRVAFYTGKTAGGLVIEEHHEDRFKDIATETGEYCDSWWEILPEEVLNGTAAPHSIPLILGNHGGGDDVMQFIDELGLLPVCERERVAIVAAYHSGITAINNKALPALVRYMLETYEALDPSRVYACGYSMGGMATAAATYGAPELFAAVCPMAIPYYRQTEEEEANIYQYDIPVMLTTSGYDAFYTHDKGIASGYQGILNSFLGYNEMDKIEYDFDAYPGSGFEPDIYMRRTLNGEYVNHTWLLKNKDGIPMVGVNVTEDLIHALYQEYGEVVYSFMRHYARNQETKEVIYNAFGF